MGSVYQTYINLLKNEGATVLGFLNPSTQSVDLSKFNALDLVVPQSLLDFWAIADGTNTDKKSTCDRIWLDGVFYYYSNTQAYEDYLRCLGLWENDETFESYWPKGFLPIATPGDGSRLLVNCRSQSPTRGHIYELFHGVGLSKHASSLSQYFKTKIAVFEANHLFVKDGIVELDFDLADILSKHMNPGCDAYDNTLLPAYEAEDWL